jgi:1-phosphofructokinase
LYVRAILIAPVIIKIAPIRILSKHNLSMILCVCLTPTLERNLITPNFEIGGFYRVQQEFLFASGKGINVARVIKRLQGEAYSIGFVGGYNGEHFKNLIKAEGLQGCWTPISG